MESKQAFVCRPSRERAFQFTSRSRRMDWGQHKMEAQRSIRTLIVEDEPLARQTIKDFVQGEDWLKVVGEAADGDSAITLIYDLRPDLVFLDVRMPGLTGLQVLESIKHDPEVVFTTAYDDHAVTAFELEALDYIIKPFGRERFRQMLTRVKLRLFDSTEDSEPAVRERALNAFKTKSVSCSSSCCINAWASWL